MTVDNIHPSHYISNSITVEPIDLFPFFKSGCVSNFFKYVVRYKDKGKLYEDLKKACYYYDYMISYNDYPDPNCKSLLILYCLKSNNDLLRVPNIWDLTVPGILSGIYENVCDKIEFLENLHESGKNCC